MQLQNAADKAPAADEAAVVSSSPLRTRKKTKEAQSIWSRVSSTWKAIGLLAIVAGFGGTVATKYVTKADLESHSGGEVALRAQFDTLAKDITSAKVDIAATRADVRSVKDTVDSTKEDIRTLTKFLLERPPTNPR